MSTSIDEQLLGPALTTADFFARVCPRVLSQRPPHLANTTGRFAFEIRGEQGGRWVIDVAAGSCTASDGPADVVLQLSDGDFLLLLRRRLDVAGALRDGRLVISGPIELLRNLSAQFQLQL